MNKLINSLLIFLFVMPVIGQAQITTNRKDGRFLSSRGGSETAARELRRLPHRVRRQFSGEVRG